MACADCANDVWLEQSEANRKEKNKKSWAGIFKVPRKMSQHRLNVSGPLFMQGNDETYSGLTSMNRWLARHCREQGDTALHIACWERDGIHPTPETLLHLEGKTGLNTRDETLSRSQLIREPARLTVNAGNTGNKAWYPADSFVYNTDDRFLPLPLFFLLLNHPPLII